MKRNHSMTDEEILQAFRILFNETEPQTDDEVDEVLLESGYDPDEVGARMKAFAESVIETTLKTYQETE